MSSQHLFSYWLAMVEGGGGGGGRLKNIYNHSGKSRTLHITMNIIWNLSILVQKFKSVDKIANDDQSLSMKVCSTSINCEWM